MFTKFRKSKNHLVLVLILLTFSLFWIKTYTYLDPDFGYRLRNGQIIFQEGIDGIRTDPFSYTMPSFTFVEHSWLSTLLIALIYSGFGMGGSALVFSIAALISLGISASSVRPKRSLEKISEEVFSKNLWHFGNPIFLLSLAIIFAFVGVRVQVVSWLLFSILLFVGLDNNRWKKYKLIVPALFLFWTNLHASFFEGILALLVIIFFRTFDFNYLLVKRSYKRKRALITKVVGSFKKGKYEVTDYLVLVASLLLTLVNPYGIGAWEKVILVASNTSLRWEINEWMPAIVSFDLAQIFFIALSVILILKYLRKFRMEQIFLYLLTLIQGIFSVRHVPLWIIVAFPMTTEAIYLLYREIEKRKESRNLFKKAYKILWSGSVAVLFISISTSIFNAIGISEAHYYPKKAVTVLRKDLPKGEIFSTYGWGGYLTWKLPEKKVFISGLMPVWEYEIVAEGELKSAYQTHSAIIRGDQDYRPVFEKFSIDTVLWDPTINKGGGLMDKLLGNALIKSGIIPESFNFGETLKDNGWVKVYEDNTAVIYKKSR